MLTTLVGLLAWGLKRGLVSKDDELWKEGTGEGGMLILTAQGWSDLNALEALAIKAGVWVDDSNIPETPFDVHVV